MVIRDQDRVRLISRGGSDRTRHFPLIFEGALRLRQRHFVIDGEAVVLGPDGVSDFAALQSGKRNEQAQLYAFDMLAGDGEDHRRLPLSLRKANLARLLSRDAPASSWPTTSKGRSVTTYSAPPAAWVSKALFRSIAAARIEAADAATDIRRAAE